MAFGDSITDGTASTMNGDDRWPNVLSRRLKALHGNKVAVVNGGIGGNQIAGPAEYGPDKPFPGGPASGQRLDRDVLALSGISSLIWLEGINDFSKNGNASTDQVIAAMKDGVDRLRKKWPQLRIIGATVVSALGSSSAAHGFPEQDAKRKALNDFIRTSGTFDGVIDFDKATLDPQSGGLKPEFVPESTTGGAGDKLHPNRTGYLAMGQAIDLDLFKPAARPLRKPKAGAQRYPSRWLRNGPPRGVRPCHLRRRSAPNEWSSYPRRRVSSTPRPFGSIVDASGRSGVIPINAVSER